VVLIHVTPASYGVDLGSENPSGADDQQETAVPCLVLEPNWIVGFVDGEGCFSVSLHRSSMMYRHGGWQLQPAFHVYQHQDHRDVLEAMVPTFGCGRIRSKGPRSSVMAFAVESLRDLESAVGRSSRPILSSSSVTTSPLLPTLCGRCGGRNI